MTNIQKRGQTPLHTIRYTLIEAGKVMATLSQQYENKTLRYTAEFGLNLLNLG